MSFDKDKTICKLFEDHAHKNLDNIALILENEELNYQELYKKSNQLARLIGEKHQLNNKTDLKPDTLIGLCVERLLNAIIGILSILKADCTYVPLDPEYPIDRLKYMINDSNLNLIITQQDFVSEKVEHLNVDDVYDCDKFLVIDNNKIQQELEILFFILI